MFRGSWSGYERDFFFHNPDSGPVFFNAGYVLGADFDDDGRAAAPVDVDGDGDLDLVELSLQGFHLLENTSPPRRFARLRLAATRSHASALGAVVKLTAGGVTQQDYVRLTDGFQSQVPVELHFGLGRADRIDRLEIAWPAGGTQVLENLPADRLLVVREGAAAAEASELPRWPEETRRRGRPDFSLAAEAALLDGGRAPLASKGAPTVVNFWGPDCAPCKQELPGLAALSKRFADRVRFAGVSVETKDIDAVRKTVAAFALPYPQFVADDALMKSFFGRDGGAPLPSTFVFDASGALRRAFQRPVTEADLAALLESFAEERLDATALDERGYRLVELGKLEEALPWFQRALAADARHPLANYHMGTLLFELGRKEQALTYLKRAVELDPGWHGAQTNLGALLHEMRDYSGAVERYREALRLKGEDLGLLIRLGGSAAAAQMIPTATDAFDRAVKAEPENPVAWGEKGRFHLFIGQLPEARKAFEAALRLDPKEPTTLRYMQDLEKMEKK